MAWEWSHTPEAYSNAYENLHDKPHDWLVVCLAEIEASTHGKDSCGFYDLDSAKYERRVKQLESLAQDVLADAIWQFAEEHRTCDNGGFNAYVCPYGCHTVPFDKEQD